MNEELLETLIVGLIVFVPVAGLTMRFALKPLIDSMIRVIELRHSSQEVQLLASRLSLMEQELNIVRGEMRQINEARDFDRRLGQPG